MLEINLNSLSGGALAEKVNIELGKLASNVMDPNTKPDVVRTLTIKVKIKPDETRQIGASEINVTSTLAASKGIPTSFVFDFNEDGNAVMKELGTRNPDRNQTQFNDQGDVTDGVGKKVVNFK